MLKTCCSVEDQQTCYNEGKPQEELKVTLSTSASSPVLPQIIKRWNNSSSKSSTPLSLLRHFVSKFHPFPSYMFSVAFSNELSNFWILKSRNIARYFHLYSFFMNLFVALFWISHFRVYSFSCHTIFERVTLTFVWIFQMRFTIQNASQQDYIDIRQ